MVEKNKDLFSDNHTLERKVETVTQQYQMAEDAYTVLQEENEELKKKSGLTEKNAKDFED